MVEADQAARDISADQVLTAVARAFDVPLAAITTAERRRMPEDARAAAIILLAELCHLTPTQIDELVVVGAAGTVAETIADRDRLLRNPIWAGFFFDAVEELTGVRPADPPALLSYQGYPVQIVEAQERSILLQFVGPTPSGFLPMTRVSRMMLRPAPNLGLAARALEDYLVWARRVVATELAWPDLTRQVRAAENALTILMGKLPPAGPATVTTPKAESE